MTGADDRPLVLRLIDTAVAAFTANADRLTELDRAIGDGDHGINMRFMGRARDSEGASLAAVLAAGVATARRRGR